MRVLLAFDKFKGSLTAEEACSIAAEAVRSARPEWEVDRCPLTDGGDGFAKILTNAAGGKMRRSRVTGPLGESVEAEFGLVTVDRIPRSAYSQIGAEAVGTLGIVEMAAGSGLALIPEGRRDPWVATSRGTGELLAAAAAAGAKEILLGIGGSATNDLGLGALSALGLKAVDEHGAPVDPPTPANWQRIARFADGPIGAPSGEAELGPIWIASDVTNPLLGARGATASYGPQKGLRKEDVKRLDHEAARIALMLCHRFDAGAPARAEALIDAPGAGAAGGIGFALSLAAGGRLIRGFPLVSAWLGLAARIEQADLVITGEGAFDATTLAGKAPGEIANRALEAGKTVLFLAGQINSELNRPGLVLRSINPDKASLADALASAGPRLAAAVARDITRP